MAKKVEMQVPNFDVATVALFFFLIKICIIYRKCIIHLLNLFISGVMRKDDLNVHVFQYKN